MTPVLRQLHWLPVEFKLEVLMFNVLNGLTPSYMSDDYHVLVSATSRRQPWSSSVQTCVLQRRPPLTTRLGDLSSRAATVEQSPSRTAITWPLPRTIPSDAKDGFVPNCDCFWRRV